MFNWNDLYGWRFGGNCVDAVGPNEADTGLFEGHPYKGLAKEILQNSLDAKNPNLPDTQPVEVEFRCIKVPVDEIPGFHRLDEIIGLCADFYNKGDDGQKLQRWVRQSKKYLSQGYMHVLKISDYHTTGLTGVTALKDTNWSGLVREKGATNKSEGKGGSHGVGKFAPYSFSSLRTVLYSTKNIDNETAFQAKTILTSFEENGQIFHNVGVFGLNSEPTSPPVYDMNEVPASFRRDQIGTDVIVAGFEHENDWKEQIVVSVLQYCFYAIYQGRLIVRVSDDDKTIEIKQDSLDSLMAEYKKWFDEHEHSEEFQFTAPKYLAILNHPKMKHFQVTFQSKGEVELYLVVDPDLDGRSIYEMRSTGMGIQEDTGWRGIGTHFNGLFIATGKNAVDKKPENNIDSFLRKCEDPAHNEWAASFYKDHQKEAKTIINEIHKWIRERILEQIPKYDGTSHDAFGLSKFIQNIHNVGDNTEEEDAFQNYEPQSLEQKTVTPSGQKKVQTQVKTNGKGKEKQQKGKKKEKKGGNPNPDNKRGKKAGKVVAVDVGRIWTPFSNGSYHVYFTPEKNYTQLQLKIIISGDEQNGDVASIRSASSNGKSLKNYFGNIVVGDVRKGEAVDITLELENQERSGLEVLAYAQQ